MAIEYEIKVLDINVEELTGRLLELGLKRKDRQSFRRFVYQLGTEGAWARLRTDGKETRLTYKHFIKNSIDGMKELEIEVSDFDTTHELMQALGFNDFIYQENQRQSFTNENIEISIDEWPKIPAYIEIEGSNENEVKDYLQKLGIKDAQTTSEPTSAVYKRYGLDIDSFSHLAF